MNKYKKVISTCIATILICGATTALAALPTLDVDFRAPAWAGANGQQSFAVGAITASAFASGFSGPVSAVLGQTATDGLGVNRTGGILPGIDDPNEIDAIERLEFTFGGTSGDNLTSVWLKQFFLDDVGFLPGNQSEQATVTLELVGPDSTTTLTANASNGEYEFNFGGPLDVSKAIFSAPASFSALVSDYSVAGFTRQTLRIQSVPDTGSTMVLFGVALIGIGSLRRRAA